MAKRSSRSGSSMVVLAALLLLVLVVLNFISDKAFFRIDLTENKEYTVSNSTRRVLRDLDDVVGVNVYFSKDLPSYMASLPRSVRDMLDEYQAYSKQKLRVQWEDPDESPEQQSKLRTLGIPQVQLDVIQKDKREVANVYLGIAVMYEDRHEVIPVVQGPWGLEYELTTAILKVTMEETPKLGIVSRFEKETLDQQYREMMRILGKQYEVEVLDLEGGAKALPEDLTTLILLGPKDLSEAEKYRIDQFLMNGGSIFACLDALEMQGGVLQGTRMSSGMEDMMTHYGVRLGNDMVVDRVASMASFSSGFFRFMSNYLLWPKVVKKGFNQDHPIVSKLETMTLPWTRSMEAVSSPPDSVEVTLLASSSPASWTTTNFMNLNPQQQFTPPKEEDVLQHGLIYALNGVFPSFFAGKPIPEIEDSTAAPIDSVGRRDIGDAAQIITVGNTYFCIDQQVQGNLVFLLNAVDWMSLGDELIGIRSRHVVDRPLKEISEGQKGLIRFIGIVAVPLVVVLIGLSKYLVRLRVKRVAETETGGAA
jgi:gliding-associated putative ABC transporter substrate-binding component GldG